MTDCLLKMQDISKSFSGVSVLESINFDLLPGEVHVLLGENGAGKSTLIKLISGAYTPTKGKIFIDGREVSIKDPRDGMKYGIGVIYQEFNLIPQMSIAENIFLGKEICRKGTFVDRKAALSRTEEIQNLLGLQVSANEKVSRLSVAQQQLVEIAKALSMNVKILVLDEPTATLTDKETRYLFDIIRKLKEKGIGIIYISHRMKEIVKIGDRATVLRDGKHIGTVKLSDVSEMELIRMMVGREINFEKKNTTDTEGETVLEVKNVGDDKNVKSVSFSLKKGTVLGVSGLVGSGRTEMAKLIIGALPKKRGEVYLNGEKVNLTSPPEAIKKGIVYLSEDRKQEGLVLGHGVEENILLPGLGKVRKFGLLNKGLKRKAAKELVARFGIKVSRLGIPCVHLSGGNQQKVVIAKWIFRGADIYIIDEPTRGIDVGARSQIYDIMDKLLEEGASIIMISSDISEILKMSDKVMVMCNGEVSAVLQNDESLTQEIILKYAIGG